MDELRANWRVIHQRMPDIHEDSYCVDDLSHLLGIPREVIFHEIAAGALKAQRVQHHTICVQRQEVLAWLDRRGPGV
ncbi:MAG TPA: hypothetical protein VKY74_01425 [Chloroflexia bacterium]|nr:hypothetical protein [Chloroflexia bacterium]